MNTERFERLPYAIVGAAVARDPQRPGGFGCLVRVAGIERRRRVVLDAELDRLRDLRSGKFGDDAEGKVDARRDPAAVKTLPSRTIRAFSWRAPTSGNRST